MHNYKLFNEFLASPEARDPPKEPAKSQRVVAEPTTLVAFDTQRILVDPSAGESPENAQWSDTAPGAHYWPKIISKGDTQVTAGSWRLLHFGQLKTWVPVSLLPSAERQSETDISHELTQERPGLQ
jgi:hypothetical protein